MQANEEEAFTEKLKDLKAETCVLSDEKSILIQDIEEYKDLIAQKEEESQRLTDIIRAKNEAIIRERQLQEEEDKYFIPCSAEDKDDITYLEGIKPRLHNPRILSMLIWQTFYQKKLTSLCNNLLGTKTVCGIYKITDKIDSRCYVGQARDVSTRWKEHVKCGCGIDTPANHKLYEAMQKDGIWNFSFELLEECPKEQLNAREKDYIEIYDSYNYGFNQNRGISK